VRLFDAEQQRSRELTDQQQTATADVLKAISRSTFSGDIPGDRLSETADYRSRSRHRCGTHGVGRTRRPYSRTSIAARFLLAPWHLGHNDGGQSSLQFVPADSVPAEGTVLEHQAEFVNALRSGKMRERLFDTMEQYYAHDFGNGRRVRERLDCPRSSITPKTPQCI
jgi:hypothetical protein